MKDCQFLLVDDSQLNSKVLLDILHDAGYRNIIVVNSPLRAISLMDDIASGLSEYSQQMDIIITNLIMPDMDGIQFCRVIKQNAEYQDIPIIMITSSTELDHLEKAYKAGVVDYITIPYKSGEVLSRIKTALRLKNEMHQRQDREVKLTRYNKMLVDDLTVAKQLQMQMLPDTIENERIYIQGYYLPVAFLGGDLYYWDKIDNGRYGIILLDVMGHGTATAMICMYLRSLLPELMKNHPDSISLINVLNSIMLDFNHHLSQNEYHCTVFYTIIDINNNTIEYVNAGHPSVALITNGQNIKWLDKGCIPVGIFADMPISNETIYFTDSAHLFMWSDGLYEFLLAKKFHPEMLLQYLSSSYDYIRNRKSMIGKLFRQIENFPRNDDISLVQIDIWAG